MEQQTPDSESANLSDIWGLDTWNRPRSDEELHTFVSVKHDNLSSDTDIS